MAASAPILREPGPGIVPGENHPYLQPAASGGIGEFDDGLMQFGHAFHDGKP